MESIAGEHLIIFRILDSECYHSQWFCLEFGFWLYCSCGFLFCLTSLVNLVLCTLRMTEFKALCLILRCRPLLRFSLLKCYWNKIFVTKIFSYLKFRFSSTLTISWWNIYDAWSPLCILGLLRGLRQMLSTEILTDRVQKIKEISLHSAHNWCSEMPFKRSKSNKK